MRFIYFVYVLLILFAFYSVFARSLKRAIIGFGALGLWASIAYVLYHAPDVAIAEAVISSVLTTILYIVTIKNYGDVSSRLTTFDWKQKTSYFIAILSFVLVAYLTYVSTAFYQSPLGISVMESFFYHDESINPIAGIILNYRVFDTVFEALLLLLSGVGVVHLVIPTKQSQKQSFAEDDPWHEKPDFGKAEKSFHYAELKKKRSITLRHKKHPSAIMTITFILPVLVLTSIYLVSDPFSPGGGFQGGAMLAAVFVSHYLIMPDHPVSTKFLNAYEKFIFLIFVALALAYILLGARLIFPELYFWYFLLIDILLGTKVFCGLSIMFICFAREHNKV